MTRNEPAPLRELRDWLSRSVAEAEAILPALLDLPLPTFRTKLDARPELRTAGMMQCLLDLAEKALGRFRRRAYELTSIAVEVVDELVLPLHEQDIARRLRGQAWKTHARALHGLRLLEEAERAIAVARGALETGRENVWYLASAYAIEAEILGSLGRKDEALRIGLVAARSLLALDDHDGYLQTLMTVGLTQHEDRGREGMVEITEMVEEAAERVGDESLVSRWKYHLGVYELGHDSVREASDWLTAACRELRALGRTADAIAAHRALAEVAIRLGRPNEAIFQRDTAYRDLLGIGALDEAAVAAAKIVELVLTIPRRVHEVRSFAASLYGVFAPLGMHGSGLQALAWLGERAEAQLLTADDAVDVRRYFEDRFLRPNAPFEPDRTREEPDRTGEARKIVRGEEFAPALAALGLAGDPHVETILTRIAAAPESGKALKRTPGTYLWRAGAEARYPALRLFYTFDEQAVSVLVVDLDDPLAGGPDEE